MSQVLTLNAGSSSLKYALFKSIGKTIASTSAYGVIEKIGQSSQIINHTECNDDIADGSRQKLKFNETSIQTHKTALEYLLNLLDDSTRKSNEKHQISIIGHRVVHGGPNLTCAKLVDDNVLNEIEKAIPLAPLHNPHNLHGIKTALNLFPKSVAQVVEFDTSFHSSIPKHAHIYGIPLEYYHKHGVRCYGFHGISHEYVSKVAANLLQKPYDTTHVISCHLGAGSSVACIQNGQSIDTSMGFTPMEGLIMATRCGDIDSGIIFYLAKQFNMSLSEIENMLTKESGFYGLSGERDARDIEKQHSEGNELALLTVETMAHRVRKYIGAYHLNLRGETNALVFTAGMGENWAYLRERCLECCDSFGFIVDKKLNEQAVALDKPMEISCESSTKKIYVIPTNEERNIAEKALELAG